MSMSKLRNSVFYQLYRTYPFTKKEWITFQMPKNTDQKPKRDPLERSQSGLSKCSPSNVPCSRVCEGLHRLLEEGSSFGRKV